MMLCDLCLTKKLLAAKQFFEGGGRERQSPYNGDFIIFIIGWFEAANDNAAWMGFITCLSYLYGIWRESLRLLYVGVYITVR